MNELEAREEFTTHGKDYDRWQLYELLKGNIPVNSQAIKFVKEMNKCELKHGVVAYLRRLQQAPKEG